MSVAITIQTAALEELNKKFGELKSQVDSLAIRDQQSFLESGPVKTSIKSYMESVKFQTGPAIAIEKEKLERLKQEQDMLLAPAKVLLESYESKVNTWKEDERRRTAEEQRRENEERIAKATAQAEIDRKERERIAEEQRKQAQKEAEAARKAGEIGKREAERLKKEADTAAEREKVRAAEDAKKAVENAPQVTVKPNIPTVAGQKNQTYYFAELTDPEPIFRELIAAIEKRDIGRWQFLRRFLMVDQAELGKLARDTKDNAKATSLVPGVRFWSKG